MTLFDRPAPENKGDNGIILVIGGSEMYTGAPYFTSIASLRTGADLVYIFSSKSAILPLKILLPECIVCPIEKTEWILARVTTCVIGPGLGKISGDLKKTIIQILDYLNMLDVPIIVDGDGLKLHDDIVARNYKRLIFTPNHNEKTKLGKSKHIYVYKGKVDLIAYQDDAIEVSNPGSGKRCAGQGDILVGIISALTSLVKVNQVTTPLNEICAIGCKINRTAARLAYENNDMGMIASDMFPEIRRAIKLEIEEEIME